jgi:D-beta-D-heptose 7-phosphate kinase/D-beta-D-heptose 1-phosphate adenosyltransferase
VIVDPKESFEGRAKYAHATCITPNIHEAERLAGFHIDSEEDLNQVGQHLLDELDLDCVLITRGAQGMTLFADSEMISIPVEAREVYDVTGAGDTAAAVFALALAAGASYDVAARLSNAAAGIVVGKVGTSTLAHDDLLRHIFRTTRSEKVVALSDLVEKVRALKEQGKTIVFTNGCFDLLHIGHVRYLERAQALGDILIVGLNSDDSVRRLKGDGRPIIPQYERANLLAALEPVDYVVLFDEDTPFDLIQTLKPDVLVKGKDYAPEEVVGREFVESNGGRLVLIDLIEGVSTSRLVERIRGV